MQIERTSNMENILGESVRNRNIVLQWKINKIAPWMSLNELENKQLFLKHQYGTGIFLSLLLLPPRMFSIDRQTNEEFVGIGTEDFL